MSRTPRPQAHDHSGAARGRAIRWSAAVASSLLVALAVSATSRAGFSANASNATSNASAGSVSLAAAGSGTQIINLSAMKPGDTTGYKCVNVTYTGTLAANVRLYGAATNTALAPYLDLEVDMGTGAPGDNALSCTGFSVTQALYSSTLSSFLTTKTNHANGLAYWDGATQNTTKSYRFKLTLQDNNLAQGLATNPAFTWEAQSA
jgi:hypothetical protein